jgi:hypothetical protein
VRQYSMQPCSATDTSTSSICLAERKHAAHQGHVWEGGDPSNEGTPLAYTLPGFHSCHHLHIIIQYSACRMTALAQRLVTRLTHTLRRDPAHPTRIDTPP